MNPIKYSKKILLIFLLINLIKCEGLGFMNYLQNYFQNLFKNKNSSQTVVLYFKIALISFSLILVGYVFVVACYNKIRGMTNNSNDDF